MHPRKSAVPRNREIVSRLITQLRLRERVEIIKALPAAEFHSNF